MNKNIGWIAFGAAGLVIIYLLFAERCGGEKEQPTIFTVTDTLYKEGDPYPIVKEGKPKIIYRDTGRIRYLAGPIDTDAVVRDYFTVNYVSDTLQADSSLLAVVNDSIYNNQIIWRQTHLQNRRPTQIITNTTIIQPPKKEAVLKFYMGAFAGYSNKTKNADVGAFATATIKSAYVSYGYGALTNSHSIRLGWKLSFRKK